MATHAATRKLLASIILPSASLILSSKQNQNQYQYQNVSFCEQQQQVDATNDESKKKKREKDLLEKKKGVTLQKRMTSIGRFSLKSETKTNPSVPTFFIALSSPPPPPPSHTIGGGDSSTSTSTGNSSGDDTGAINRNHDSMSPSEFISTWYNRNMPTLHPRFHYKVSSTNEGYFEPIHSDNNSNSTIDNNNNNNNNNNNTLEEEKGNTLYNKNNNTKNNNKTKTKTNIQNDMKKNHVTETLHMNMYRQDLKKRIEDLVSTFMDVKEKLWLVQISSGELGSSGAISKQRVETIRKERETISASTKDGNSASNSGMKNPLKESVLLFKCHHSMGDAVSLTAALGDLLDEAQEIRQMITNELKRRKDKMKKASWWKKMFRMVQKLIWFLFGSIQAITKQTYLVLTTRRNPFLDMLEGRVGGDDLYTTNCGRSISWCDVASVDEVKVVAKKLGGEKATVNDVFVSCITAAIARQVAEHRNKYELLDDLNLEGKENVVKRRKSHIYKKINVVIPAHLGGGIVPPGKGIGNYIGAFVTRVPCEMEKTSCASDRLLQVHHSLDKSKRSPASIISFLSAKFISQFVPERLAVHIFHKGSANATAAITNIRSYEKKVHINGRTVESMAGFLPLPPNIPIGVAVQSYGSVVSLSINAETWAVPDADKFLTWVLDEYKLLCIEASSQK